MGVEPTQDGITAPQTVLKTAPVTGPEAAPQALASYARAIGHAPDRPTQKGRGAVFGAPPRSIRPPG